MKKYPEYRESGSELIDMLPTHWRIVPLTKYLNSIIDYRGRTPKKIENGGQLLVTARNIKMGRIDYSLSEEYVDPEDAQALLNRGKPEIGDVLFTTEAPLGEVANVDNVDIALAQRIVKFSGKKDILDNFFLKYWILSHTFQNDLLSHATGSTAKGIKASKFNILKLVLPTYTEQKQISLFLDIKTVQINSLIDKKQQMIELLKEERAAIINQAVTKGINPDAEMKDSGIEWLGEVPKHWEVKKIKHVSTKIGSGITPKGGAEVYQTSGIPLLRSQNVHFTGLKLDDVAYITQEIHESMSNSEVFEGDVLLNITGASIGRCYYAEKDILPANVNQHVCIIRPNNEFRKVLWTKS